MVTKTKANLKKSYTRKPLDPGVAPRHFDEPRKEIWKEVIDLSPLRLLVEHKHIVTQYCQLIHRARTLDEPLKSAESRLLREYATDLGMMPSGRSAATPDGEDDIDSAPEAKKAAVKKKGFDRFKEPPRPPTLQK